MSDNDQPSDGDEFNNDANSYAHESSDDNSNSDGDDSSHGEANFNDTEISDTSVDNHDRSIVKSVIHITTSVGLPDSR